MSTQPDQFDDPTLKSAVRSAYGAERAPAELRERIVHMLAAEAIMGGPVRLSLWRLPALRRIAAVIVIGVIGLAAWAAFYAFHGTNSPGGLNQDLLLAMVATHDRCCQGTDHHGRGIPQDNWNQMGQAIGQRLHEPVLVADLGGDGWKFLGAAICPVAGKPCAHLVFARGEQRMSVFSMPAGYATTGERGEVYAQAVNDHMIAGFAAVDGVYCMVGTCPNKALKIDEVRTLLARHQHELVAASAVAARPGTAEVRPALFVH